MNSREMLQSILRMDDQIKQLQEADITVMLPFAGKPEYHIESSEPLLYKNFGVFRNRAPHIAGQATVHGLVVSDSKLMADWITPVAVFEASSHPEELFASHIDPEQYRSLQRSIVAGFRYLHS